MTTLARTWHGLGSPPTELRVVDTLLNGQCFGWHMRPTKTAPHPELIGVVGDKVVGLREMPEDTLFTCYNNPQMNPTTLKDALSNYFQLHIPLQPLYRTWAKKDMRLKTIAKCIPGLRILRQDPTECLVSFLCSSNNNISRITQMLAKLREKYGTLLYEADDQRYYSFPSLECLCAVEEQDLRDMGFGYRAPFIVRSAQHIVRHGGMQWLEDLREEKDMDALREKLLTLHGVGRKVADCVAVFSLDKAHVVPVDTHVWEIACRDMDPTLARVKSLTPVVHQRVNDIFIERYGTFAGWAHSLLFAAELPRFASRLPRTLQEEMKSFREECKQKRAETKREKTAASPSPSPKVKKTGQVTKMTTTQTSSSPKRQASRSLMAAHKTAPRVVRERRKDLSLTDRQVGVQRTSRKRKQSST